MRIAIYDDDRIGVVAGDETIVDITDLLQPYEIIGPEDFLSALTEHFRELSDELHRRVQAGGGKPLTEIRLRSPIKRPTKIVCLVGNYREGTDRPLQTLDIFFKSPEAIIGPGDEVVLPPHDASIFHHEGEIAAVIGRDTSDVSQDDAMNHVFGYTVFNDISARGLGREGTASFLGKSFDTFAAFGPWIVTADEIDDLYNLRVTVECSGEVRQDYNTSDMERPVAELISYISSVTPLHPGDVICCGTNHQGLGAMQDGDVVTTVIDQIGSFTVRVRDPQQRTWERGIDQATAERVRNAAASGGGANR